MFDYIPEEKLKKPVTTEIQVPEQIDDIKATTIKGVDHWTKDGRIWTRHHVASRTKLFRPELALDGPKLDHLEDERITTMRTMDGETTSIADNWRDPKRAELTTKCTWTGVTVFNEKVTTLRCLSMTTLTRRVCRKHYRRQKSPLRRRENYTISRICHTVLGVHYV